jgi:hypothetical protein
VLPNAIMETTELMAVHRDRRMIAARTDARHLHMAAVVSRLPTEAADQRPLTGAAPLDAQRPRMAVADTAMEVVEAERHLMVAVTAEVADLVAAILPAEAVAVTQAAVTRMEGAADKST